DYIERHTHGWPDFEAEIRKYPVSRVAEITGLPEDRIRALGVRLAHTRPTGIRATMGIQRHGGGGTALRTIACIPGVTGDWQYPGGGAADSTAAYGPLTVDTRPDLLAKPVRTLTMTRLAEQLDGSVKCLWVYAANPVGSNPDQNRVRAALRR